METYASVHFVARTADKMELVLAQVACFAALQSPEPGSFAAHLEWAEWASHWASHSLSPGAQKPCLVVGLARLSVVVRRQRIFAVEPDTL